MEGRDCKFNYSWAKLRLEETSSLEQDLPPFHPPPSSPSLKMLNLLYIFCFERYKGGKYCTFFGRLSGKIFCFCCPQDKKTFVEFVSFKSFVMVADIFTYKVHQFEQKHSTFCSILISTNINHNFLEARVKNSLLNLNNNFAFCPTAHNLIKIFSSRLLC